MTQDRRTSISATETIMFKADGESICAPCAEMRYVEPRCNACGSLPLRGWLALGKLHKDCAERGTFQAHDDRCDPIEAVREHRDLLCEMCTTLIPARRNGERYKDDRE